MADKENPECVYQLALLYLNGVQGVIEPDLNYAKSLILEAVELEYPQAFTTLAEFYGRGELGFDLDASKCVALHEKAALLGNAESILALGLFYMNGENGFEKNMEKAVEQIERAAGLNLPAGIYHLAHLKEQGQGVEENLGEALELYCKAADMGK